MNRDPRWQDVPRIEMSLFEREAIEGQLAAGEPLADPEQMTRVLEDLVKPESLDAWEVTNKFVDCFQGTPGLFASDLGLLRARTVKEQTSAVFGAHEEEYGACFMPDTRALLTSRLAALLSCGGRGLWNASGAPSSEQPARNVEVADNVLTPLNIDGDVKKAVVALVGQDIVGDFLRTGRREDIEQQFGAFWNIWPHQFGPVTHADFLVVNYMSRMRAHTEDNVQLSDADTPIEESVTPTDAQLTDLLEPNLVTPRLLRPDLRQRMANLLSDTRYARELVEPSEANPLVRQFDVVLEELFRRHPDQVEKDRGEDQLSLDPSDTIDSVVHPDANEIIFYRRANIVIDEHPLRIPRPYATVMEEGQHPVHYYKRGGQVVEFREDGRRRAEYGTSLPERPLSDAELESLNLWLESSQSAWTD